MVCPDRYPSPYPNSRWGRLSFFPSPTGLSSSSASSSEEKECAASTEQLMIREGANVEGSICESGADSTVRPGPRPCTSHQGPIIPTAITPRSLVQGESGPMRVTGARGRRSFSSGHHAQQPLEGWLAEAKGGANVEGMPICSPGTDWPTGPGPRTGPCPGPHTKAITPLEWLERPLDGPMRSGVVGY